jgi:hypothetical protein
LIGIGSAKVRVTRRLKLPYVQHCLGGASYVANLQFCAERPPELPECAVWYMAICVHDGDVVEQAGG